MRNPISYICSHASGCENAGCHWHSPRPKIAWTSAFCTTKDEIVLMLRVPEDGGEVRPFTDPVDMMVEEIRREIDDCVKDLTQLLYATPKIGQKHETKIAVRRLSLLWRELKERKPWPL